MNKKNSKADNNFSKDIFVAALIFLLGSKITIIASLIHKAYLALLKPGGDHDLKNTIEFTLLGLAVGAGVLVVVRLLSTKNNEKNNSIIITGVIIGLLAAVLQIAELTFIKNDFPIDNFFRSIFFILILVFLVGISLVNNQSTKSTHEYAVVTLSRIVIALMTGFIAGLLTSLLITIGFKTSITTSTSGSFSKITNDFEFTPLAYLTLSTAWVTIAFADRNLEYPSTLKEFLPRKSLVFKAINCTVCVLVAFLYGAIITEMGNEGESNFQTKLGSKYALLTAITMGIFWILKAPVIKFKITEMLIIFFIVGLGYFLSFGHSPSTSFGLPRSIIYGMLGVCIYYILGLSHRITISILGKRLFSD